MSKGCGCQKRFEHLEKQVEELFKTIEYLKDTFIEYHDLETMDVCEDGVPHVYGVQRDEHFNRVCVKCSRKETK